MKTLIISFLLIGLAAAFNVTPAYIEVQDTGNENLPVMDIRMTINCDTKEVSVQVLSNQTKEPVQGAKAYMFYTDYSYQALPNTGTTNGSGNVSMAVPGTIRFLTALFILRVDHADFRSREIEFTYKKCFEPPPPPPKPPSNATNQTNQTAPGCASNDACADDEFCSAAGECEAIAGTCGEARNHTFVPYECGEPPDCAICPQGKMCVEHRCVEEAAPPANNQSNGTQAESPTSACPLGALALVGLVFASRR
ncbi:MAG: hypothetical protein AB1324_02135 [Candidatus Micrarchaeota archaeon]